MPGTITAETESQDAGYKGEAGAGMKIVIAGGPHTGKSCLREHLKRALAPRAAALGLYPYVIDASPDGEGSWYQEAVSRDRRGADHHRSAHKRAFTEAFADRVSQHVSDCSEPLVLIDVGGRITDEQRLICAGATHIVILHRAGKDLATWRAFARELRLVIVAELRSDYHATGDRIHDVGQPLRAMVHHLERGELDEPHPAIDLLAETILTMTNISLEEPVTTPDRPFALARHGRMLKVSFGASAPGDVIVKDIVSGLAELDAAGELEGGGLLGINGACTLAGMAVLVHHLVHRFAALAVFDPKLPAYIVVVSHDPRWSPGDRLTNLDEG